jgi:serine O-acetyltransferase
MAFTSPNSQKPLSQLSNLVFELRSIVNHRPYRWISCWFSGATHTIISYRIDRFGFLLFKQGWVLLRFLLLPYQFLVRMLGGNHEIHYKADIGRGLMVLHPALGIVVSGYTVAGTGLLLTGGNCIGIRKKTEVGDLVLGNNVHLGANAVILGPVHIADNVRIGAGAVVINDAPANAVLVGVPASQIGTINFDLENLA